LGLFAGLDIARTFRNDSIWIYLLMAVYVGQTSESSR